MSPTTSRGDPRCSG